MRASRLLSLLLLLQSRGLMSAARLADELGVTARTVYRDVEALAEAGVPIYAEHGPAGGYRLLDGYRTRLTGLTADEAGSLVLTGLPEPAAELGFGAHLAAAELKLAAALPVASQDASRRIRQRFHLDAPSWFRDPDEVPHLLAVADAVWQERVIEVHYRRWAPRPGVVVRRLHPLGLVLKAGVWYLVAAQEHPPPGGRGRSVGGGGERVRTYRVTKILELASMSEQVDRPEGFDLAVFWRGHVERYEQAAHQDVAVVRLSPAGVQSLSDVVDSRTSRAALRTLGPPEGDGWCRATIPVESVERAAVDLLKLGADVRVLAPAALVARIAGTIRAMAAHYEGASGRSHRPAGSPTP